RPLPDRRHVRADGGVHRQALAVTKFVGWAKPAEAPSAPRRACPRVYLFQAGQLFNRHAEELGAKRRASRSMIGHRLREPGRRPSRRSRANARELLTVPVRWLVPRLSLSLDVVAARPAYRAGDDFGDVEAQSAQLALNSTKLAIDFIEPASPSEHTIE